MVGSGTFRVDQLATFTGFESIRLDNATNSSAQLTLGNQPIEVDATGPLSIQVTPSNWNASNIIKGDISRPVFMSFFNNSGVFPSLPVTYDLTSNTFSHVTIGNVGDQVTLLINNAVTAGVQSLSGLGPNAKLATAGSTLDLSHTTVSQLQVTSTNALGTAFTVGDLGTAFQIAGGAGQDTITASASCSSFSLMSDMPRGTIFGRRVGDQPETFVEHFIRCPTCGGWIDYRDLGHVLDHEGPLPHRRDQSSSALRWFGTPREVISTPALTEMTRP